MIKEKPIRIPLASLARWRTLIFIFCISTINIFLLVLANESRWFATPLIDDDAAAANTNQSFTSSSSTGLLENGVCSGCYGADRILDEIQIHVIGWRRDTSLQRLLQQLSNANYDSWDKPVILNIHLDGEYSSNVSSIAESFYWPHGRKILDMKETKYGLRGMWLDSLGKASAKATNNTLLLTFEDDVIVSPSYFQWLLIVVDKYSRNPDCRDSNLVGFSFSPLIYQEMYLPFHPWRVEEFMGDTKSAVYLSSVPSSWGAAYWADHWKQFDAFVNVRLSTPFYNTSWEENQTSSAMVEEVSPSFLRLPGSLMSNYWPKSWKRFMVDFMYGRGLVMLYPNLRDQKGLATALQENGEHIDPTEFDRNPRVANLVGALKLDEEWTFPYYCEMLVFGLDHQKTSKERLAALGAKFLGKMQEQCDHCQDLVSVWAKHDWQKQNPIADPFICVVDLHSASVQYSTKKRANERYLMFEPQFGLGSQLFDIVKAYALAEALGRTLVIPQLFIPDTDSVIEGTNIKQWLEFEDFFHLCPRGYLRSMNSSFYKVAGSWRSVTFSQMKVGRVEPFRVIKLNSAARNPSRLSSNLQIALGSQNITEVYLEHLFREPTTREQFQHSFGGCEDEVLAFEGIKVLDIEDISPLGVWVDTLIINSDILPDLAFIRRKVIHALGTSNFCCYHLGGDDEISFHGKNTDQSLAQAREFSFHNHGASVQDLQISILEDNTPAFISSDFTEADDKSLRLLTVATVTSKWISKILENTNSNKRWPSEIKLLAMLAEQDICVRAQRAVLNPTSALSQQIQARRQKKNCRYWNSATGFSIGPLIVHDLFPHF